MKKRKDIITVAIDSPAAAGAGTQAKLIAKHYNLLQLDTGRIYRLIGKLKLENPKKFSYSLIRKKINNLKIKNLQNKNLLSDKVATSASIIAKDKKIRNIVHQFQQKCAYAPPMKYAGSVLDGRDITSVICRDAMFKFFITASLKERAKRRYKELKKISPNTSLKKVKNALKRRDFFDKNRKESPLLFVKGSVLVVTTNLSIKKMRLKLLKIVGNAIKRKYGNL